MRKKPQETGREHGKEIGKHKPIGTAKGRYGMGCDAGKVIKIHDQENWTKQEITQVSESAMSKLVCVCINLGSETSLLAQW